MPGNDKNSRLTTIVAIALCVVALAFVLSIHQHSLEVGAVYRGF